MRLEQRLIVIGGFILSSACSDSGSNSDGTGSGVMGAGGSTSSGGSGGMGTATGGATGSGGMLLPNTGGLSSTGGAVVGPGNGGSNATGGSGNAGSGNAGSGNAGSNNGGSSGNGGGGGSSGSDGGSAGQGGGGGGGGATPAGKCCSDGMCLCHGDPPSALTASKGPYMTKSYTISGVGCVFYPTDAEAPFAGVDVSDGFGGSGGCNSAQTGQWGPLYASWGIVAMIIDTGAGDQPNVRGMKLTAGITALKAENTKMGSPLMGKMAGRWGTSGFSMGGGGTTYAAQADPTLLTNVAIMAWQPVTMGIKVPSLFICGSSDTLAGCANMGTPSYNSIADTVPKMRVTIQSGHAGQPSSGGGKSGQYGLAFQKVFLENDTRWRPLLVAAGAMADATNIK